MKSIHIGLKREPQAVVSNIFGLSFFLGICILKSVIEHIITLQLVQIIVSLNPKLRTIEILCEHESNKK